MADKIFLCNIDLNQNQLLNPLFQVLGVQPNPINLDEAQFWYNSTTNLPYYFDGTNIRPFNYIAPGTITNLEISPTANIELSKLEVNPLDRALHSGTQLANTISDLASTVQAYTLDLFAAPVSDLDINNNNLINVADPVNPLDAVNLQTLEMRVDGISSIKDPVRVTTPQGTGNIALTGLQTIDGVSLAVGDRVLLREQTNPAENNIWVVDTGVWSLAEDANETGELENGTLVFINEGTDCANIQMQLNTLNPIIVGTTGLSWVKRFSVADVVAGDGLTKNGTTIDAVGTTDRILVTADRIDIHPNYVGQDSINTVGTIVSGTWNGEVIDAQFLDLSGVVAKYAETIGNGALTSIPVTHSLGTQDVTVSVRQTSDNMSVETCWTATDPNTVTFDFNVAPTANEYRVTIIG